MNCHENKKDTKNQSGHKHSPLKHMLHMVLCCGLPILILFVLPFITRINPSVGGFLLKIVPFICPIMMISMIPMMMGMGKEKSCCSSKDNKNEKESGKLNQSIE
ncbi:MAG: hypothetical protein ABRQ27_09425 [Clostridiaceae bacterium]